MTDCPGKPICAVAHPNIALVKYWGKHDIALNLPAAGSISITLDQIRTRTQLSLVDGQSSDQLELNGQPTTIPARMQLVLDQMKKLAGERRGIQINTENNFPTAAGLASSASGYAALAVGLNRLLKLELDDPQLSIFARRGSGSAARSVFGGFVEMADGDDQKAFATPLQDASHWPLNIVIAITSEQQKKASSSKGMEQSRLTSPYYSSWVDTVNDDLPIARTAINSKDFEALAAVSEASCLKMHAVMLSTNPGLIYWQPATIACMHEVRSLRETGVPVFFTIDAGPQLKVICPPEHTDQVAQALDQIPGVLRTITVSLGSGARIE